MSNDRETEAELKLLGDAVDEGLNEIAGLCQEVSSLKAINDSLLEQLKDREHRIAELISDVSDKEYRIADLEFELEAAKRKILMYEGWS